MTRAREIEEVAALMVMRREGVDWTDRDEAALASWLGESALTAQATV